MRPRNRRQNGTVFVITLAVLAALVAIVTSIAASQRLNFRSEMNRMEQRRARLAAESGVQRAIAILYDLATAATSGTGTTGGATTLQDEWALLGNQGQEKFIVGGESFRIQIVDASSLINLNTAPEGQLVRLPLTQEQVDSILDWREAGVTARGQGAKDDYYNNLPFGYNAALRRFDSLDQLLQVRGFTAPDVFEIPQNQSTTAALPNLADGRTPVIADLVCVDSYSQQIQSNGQAKVNVNNPNLQVNQLLQAGIQQPAAGAIIAGRQTRGNYASIGAVCAAPGVSQNFYRPILDALTVSGAPRVEGKLNLNTVTETVLNTIPNLQTDVIQAIIQKQGQGFTALSDLLTIPGLNSVQALTDFAGYFDVRSNTFLIRVVGKAGSTEFAFQAVVDIQNGTPRILRMEEQPFKDMPARWGWPDDTTSETTLVEPS